MNTRALLRMPSLVIFGLFIGLFHLCIDKAEATSLTGNIVVKPAVGDKSSVSIQVKATVRSVLRLIVQDTENAGAAISGCVGNTKFSQFDTTTNPATLDLGIYDVAQSDISQAKAMVCDRPDRVVGVSTLRAKSLSPRGADLKATYTNGATPFDFVRADGAVRTDWGTSDTAGLTIRNTTSPIKTFVAGADESLIQFAFGTLKTAVNNPAGEVIQNGSILLELVAR